MSNFELLRRAATAAAVCAGMVQAGCSGRPLQGVMIPTSEAAPGATQVPVLVATTRKKSTVDPGETLLYERFYRPLLSGLGLDSAAFTRLWPGEPIFTPVAS